MSEPHTQLREQIARIIDPVAYEDFPVGGPEPDHDWWDREQALRKADAILSLLAPSVGDVRLDELTAENEGDIILRVPRWGGGEI